MPKILNILKIAVPTLVVVLAVNFVLADWAAPACGPTGCNVPAPINVGNTTQIKLGALQLNTAIPMESVYGLDVFGISRFFGNLEIGNASYPSKVKIVDGTQGAGKILTSDANGLSSWQTLGGAVPAVTQIIAGAGIAIDPTTGTGTVTISTTASPVSCRWYDTSSTGGSPYSANVLKSTYDANGGVGTCRYSSSVGVGQTYGFIVPREGDNGNFYCFGAGGIQNLLSSFSYLGCSGIQ